MPCAGCRNIEGKCPIIQGTCSTYTCVKEKGVEFCYECGDFPCAMLQPASDRAAVLPHNLKVFNLCSIQNKGLDRFIQDYAEIKRKYYQGKMAIGKGPQV